MTALLNGEGLGKWGGFGGGGGAGVGEVSGGIDVYVVEPLQSSFATKAIKPPSFGRGEKARTPTLSA